MFFKHAIRMLRNRWASAEMLAQELYAIFCQSDLPLEHQGPITLDKPAGEQPAVKLRGFRDDDPILEVEDPDGGDPILLTPEGLDMGGRVIRNARLEDTDQEEPPTSNVLLGTIVSGEGDTWSVSTDQGTIEATQLNANAFTALPVDLQVIVYKINGLYYINVPLWLP